MLWMMQLAYSQGGFGISESGNGCQEYSETDLPMTLQGQGSSEVNNGKLIFPGVFVMRLSFGDKNQRFKGFERVDPRLGLKGQGSLKVNHGTYSNK